MASLLSTHVLIFLLLTVMMASAALLLFTIRDQKRTKSATARVLDILPVAPEFDEPDEVKERAGRKLVRFLPPVWQAWAFRALQLAGDEFSPIFMLLAGVFGATLAVGAASLLELGVIMKIVLGSILGLLFARAVLKMAQGRHRDAFLDTFPDAIDLILRAIRAGLPVAASLEIVAKEIQGPTGLTFTRITAETRIGRDLDDALRRASTEIAIPDFSFFVASLLLQRESGGNLSDTLSNLSATVRKRRELRLKIKAMTSEARTSALIIGALPVASCVLLGYLNPDYIGKLFFDHRGNLILLGGVTSLSMGALCMQFLIKRATR